MVKCTSCFLLSICIHALSYLCIIFVSMYIPIYVLYLYPCTFLSIYNLYPCTFLFMYYICIRALSYLCIYLYPCTSYLCIYLYLCTFLFRMHGIYKMPQSNYNYCGNCNINTTCILTILLFFCFQEKGPTVSLVSKLMSSTNKLGNVLWLVCCVHYNNYKK